MSSKEYRIVRILLVGDPQSGKTSIILALVGEEFPPFVPPRAEEITIPGDVTPEKVPTHILDYSSQEQDDRVLFEEIAKAHVVCVVYDLTRTDSLDRVTSYWLPLIKQCSTSDSKPVVLAGNKADLPYDSEAQSTRLQEILNTCLEVETGLECSAKELHNVSELFYFAQKAVLHPTAPLYSPDRQLKPDCVEALTRVFKICDMDNDQLLNDQELNDFQIRCFDAPLQPQALADVKSIVERNVENGVTAEGLTLEGFLFLNKLFIQRGRHETTWKIVRRFGYSNSLQLRDEYLQPIFSPRPGSSVELTPAAYQFLTSLFHKYDKDGDQALSPAEQMDLFSLCLEEPWTEELIADTVETNAQGWITMAGFLAFWTLQTSLDYTDTAQFLAWMGYPILQKDTLSSALQEVRSNERNKLVYRCLVLGSTGCGKSSFVRGLIGREQVAASMEEGDAVAIKTITLPNSTSSVYLMLQENAFAEEDFLDARPMISGVLDQCDVACLLYDRTDPDSFAVAATMMDAIDSLVSNLIPCVFITTKSDLSKVKQDYVLQPDELCKERGIPVPIPVSVTTSDLLTPVYHKLACIARDPSKNLPSTFSISHWVKVSGIGVFLGLGLGVLLYYLHKTGRFRIAIKPSQ